MTIPLRACPRCGKEPKILRDFMPTIHSISVVRFMATCETDNCSRAFGSSEEQVAKSWNRIRGPQLSLEGDELGASIPDPMARQQILSRLTREPKGYGEMIGGFPSSRIMRLLEELVQSGDAIMEILPIPGMFQVTNKYWRLASEPTPVPTSDTTNQSAIECLKGVSPMARKSTNPATDEAQIPLIDVEHPMAKKFKTLRRKYEGLIDQKNEASQAAKQVRTDIITLIRENNIKPNVDGVIRFEMDGEVIEIAPGESKLHFKSKPKPEDAAKEEDEDAK